MYVLYFRNNKNQFEKMNDDGQAAANIALLAVPGPPRTALYHHRYTNPHGKHKHTLYTLDFVAMTQSNPDSDSVREIGAWWEDDWNQPFVWTEGTPPTDGTPPADGPPPAGTTPPAVVHQARADGTQPSDGTERQAIQGTPAIAHYTEEDQWDTTGTDPWNASWSSSANMYAGPASNYGGQWGPSWENERSAGPAAVATSQGSEGPEAVAPSQARMLSMFSNQWFARMGTGYRVMQQDMAHDSPHTEVEKTGDDESASLMPDLETVNHGGFVRRRHDAEKEEVMEVTRKDFEAYMRWCAAHDAPTQSTKQIAKASSPVRTVDVPPMLARPECKGWTDTMTVAVSDRVLACLGR